MKVDASAPVQGIGHIQHCLPVVRRSHPVAVRIMAVFMIEGLKVGPCTTSVE